eukprot:TRINITY_DN1422_c0_g1_i3.p1 TRINITY_DN1422_c0_g1~~TRINITY_DN1422_c0_g1_i3.p1  ORF type:complete len:161 (-),score=2.68 TRINITY_DN1422_c0_g1_i3:82-564(-)
MIFLPNLWSTRRLIKSLLTYIPLVGIYSFLLFRSWEPDTLNLMMPGSLEKGIQGGGFNPQFFPTLESISVLLSRTQTAISFWIHYLLGNMVIGRYIYLDGLEKGMITFFSLFLAFFCGPLGLIAHLIMVLFSSIFSNGKRRKKPVKFNHNGGKIILEPYQ